MNKKIILSAFIGLIIGAGGVMVFGTQKQSMPVATNTQNNSTMASLEGKKGEAFDREFITQMTIHHQGAIQMAEMALQSSKRPEIKQLSREIIAAQNTEIQQMKEWYQTWFGSSVPVTSAGHTQTRSMEKSAQ